MVLSRHIHVGKKQYPNLLYEGTVLGQIPTRALPLHDGLKKCYSNGI